MGKIKFHWNKDTVVLMAKKQWGKTTTINILTGIIKPTKGSVSIAGY